MNFSRGLAQTAELQGRAGIRACRPNRGRRPSGPAQEFAFGAVHEFDHCLVTALGVFVEAEDAMLQQYDAAQGVPVGIAGSRGHLPGEDETGHDVGQHQHLVSVQFAQDALSVR